LADATPGGRRSPRRRVECLSEVKKVALCRALYDLSLLLLPYRQMLALAPPYVILEKPEQILVMDKFDRITFDPQIMGGRACIRGMRVPVSVIIGQIAHGATKEEVLADDPDLEPGDIQQALECAAWLVQEEVVIR